MHDKGYPEFSAPEELELEGDKGEAMVTWKRKPNGKVCITSFEGVSLGGGEEDVVEETEAPMTPAMSAIDSASMEGGY